MLVDSVANRRSTAPHRTISASVKRVRSYICRLIIGRCRRFSDRIRNAGRSRSGLSYVTHNATLETDVPHIHAITMPFPHALIVLIASLRSAAHPYLAAPRGLSRPLDLAERSDRARQGGSRLRPHHQLSN